MLFFCKQARASDGASERKQSQRQWYDSMIPRRVLRTYEDIPSCGPVRRSLFYGRGERNKDTNEKPVVRTQDNVHLISD